jgi:hypothetical protein
MNLADVAPDPTVTLGTLACAGLACLFVVSAIILTIVLVRRSRKGGSGGVA